MGRREGGKGCEGESRGDGQGALRGAVMLYGDEKAEEETRKTIERRNKIKDQELDESK